MKTFYQAQTKLKPAPFMLYSAIFTTIQYTGEDFIMTDAELAEKYEGLSERTITRYLPELVAEGYITLSHGQKINLNGQITILNGEAYRTIKPTDVIKPTKNSKIVKNRESNNKSIETFEIFWKNRVKNKIGKDAALKAWIKLSIEEQRLAYKMISYYYNTIDDSKFFAHTSTWLNGKRFNDENLIPSHEAKSGKRWNDHVEETDAERKVKLDKAVEYMKSEIKKRNENN
jgi:hypothetical protein